MLAGIRRAWSPVGVTCLILASNRRPNVSSVISDERDIIFKNKPVASSLGVAEAIEDDVDAIKADKIVRVPFLLFIC